MFGCVWVWGGHDLQTASSSQRDSVRCQNTIFAWFCPVPHTLNLTGSISCIMPALFCWLEVMCLCCDWWMTMLCVFMILFACWCEMFFAHWCYIARKTFSSFIKLWKAPDSNCQHCGDGGVTMWITSHCFSANRTKVIFLTHTWLCMLTHTQKKYCMVTFRRLTASC